MYIEKDLKGDILASLKGTPIPVTLLQMRTENLELGWGFDPEAIYHNLFEFKNYITTITRYV